MSEHHVVSKSVYFAIFATLIIFTFVTRMVAKVDLGQWNIVVALTIAIIKATLVVLFFMHLRYSERLIHVVVVAGFFWLSILLVLTFSDYLFRAWIPLLQ